MAKETMLQKLGLWPMSKAAVAHRIANAYSFMHADRVPGKKELGDAAAHILRKMPVANADPARFALNRTAKGGKTIAEVYADYESLKAERSKETLTDNGDPTEIIHLLITFPSNAWIEAVGESTTDEFKRRAEKYADSLYGEQNVLVKTWHYDEETPHLHVLLMPLQYKLDNRGRPPKDPSKAKNSRMKWFLNASSYMGDSHTMKEVMSKRQDEWHAQVADLGILRGKKAELTGAKQTKGPARADMVREAAAEVAELADTVVMERGELVADRAMLQAERAAFEREKEEWSRSVADARQETIDAAHAEGDEIKRKAHLKAAEIKARLIAEGEAEAARSAEALVVQMNQALNAALDKASAEANAVHEALKTERAAVREAAVTLTIEVPRLINHFEQMGGKGAADALKAIDEISAALGIIRAKPAVPPQAERLRQIRKSGIKAPEVAKLVQGLQPHEFAKKVAYERRNAGFVRPLE